ncbi:unnamed protein product [Linum tenue]|uniref:Centromere protein C n=1 Tax=Linum tenue TaxID=586396 RepID=A0AAV0KNZ8_9ROSI|nr:unnamed protein product [Linum tenue]
MTNLENPLQGYGGLALFRRTFPSLPKDFRSDDLLSAHNFLKSLPIKDHDKLVEQAENILSGRCELPAADPAKVPPSEDNGEAAGSKLMEKPRERRPGLGRKRARFSLLPDFSQPSINLEPTFDIDKHKDPEEFFAAFERLEDAKKEIAKQTGHVQTSSYQQGAPLPSRPRRPGIPGRSRTAKYIHLYPTTQENSEAELLNPYPGASQPVATDSNAKLQEGTLEENELGDDSSDEKGPSGAVTEPGGKVDKVLDDLSELLSQDFEGLDEDKTVSLFGEKFQFKPVHIEKLNLPEFHDIPTFDWTSSRAGNLNKPRRPLSDIDNILKETKGRSFMKLKKGETSGSTFGFDSLPKSPLPSLARKLISQSDPLVDPFPFYVDDIGSLPETNASLMGDVSQGDTAKELNSAMIDECDHTVGVISSPVMADFTVPSDRTTEDYTTTLNSDEEDGDNFCAEVEGENKDGNDKEGNENLECGTTSQMVEGENNGGNDEAGNENLDQYGTTNEMEETETVDSAQPGVIIEENIATDRVTQTEFGQSSSVVMDDHETTGRATIQSKGPEEDLVDSYDEHNENHSEEPRAVMMKEPIKGNTRKRKSRSNKYMTKKQRRTVTKKSVVDDCSKAKHTAEESSKIAAVIHEQQTIHESLMASANGQTRAATRPLKGRESRSFSQRKSLIGAGSSYATEGGLRRSTRIRSRPLEFWNGERFLYGRVHQSLATVIGIKYQSPGKDEGKKPVSLKVKSFVSDEYQHLVDLAAQG